MTLRQILMITLLIIAGCSEQNDPVKMVQKAQAIESSDECHLCGMIIENFPGPKGQAYRKEIDQASSNKVKKFCSTRDLFSYYLDPEHQRNVTAIYVHDMSKMPWQHLDDNFFINAKSAWYVVGSERTGAMGATLASFSDKTDAQVFANEFGGMVVAFKEITFEHL